MLWKIEELKEKKFGHLKIAEELPRWVTSSGKFKRYFLCKCDCGNFVKIVLGNLLSGNTQHCTHSCPFRDKSIHKQKGLTKTFKLEYSSFKHMLGRCYDPKESGYDRYGAVGVVVCDRWRDEEFGFLNFVEDLGKKPSKNHSLNRVNSANTYSPETCEWASCSVQGYDQKIRTTNKSGKTGVSWRRDRQKWDARICVDNKIICLGLFEDYDEAVKVRQQAELKYFGFNKE